MEAFACGNRPWRHQDPGGRGRRRAWPCSDRPGAPRPRTAAPRASPMAIAETRRASRAAQAGADSRRPGRDRHRLARRRSTTTAGTVTQAPPTSRRTGRARSRWRSAVAEPPGGLPVAGLGNDVDVGHGRRVPARRRARVQLADRRLLGHRGGQRDHPRRRALERPRRRRRDRPHGGAAGRRPLRMRAARLPGGLRRRGARWRRTRAGWSTHGQQDARCSRSWRSAGGRSSRAGSSPGRSSRTTRWPST